MVRTRIQELVAGWRGDPIGAVFGVLFKQMAAIILLPIATVVLYLLYQFVLEAAR